MRTATTTTKITPNIPDFIPTTVSSSSTPETVTFGQLNDFANEISSRVSPQGNNNVLGEDLQSTIAQTIIDQYGAANTPVPYSRIIRQSIRPITNVDHFADSNSMTSAEVTQLRRAFNSANVSRSSSSHPDTDLSEAVTSVLNGSPDQWTSWLSDSSIIDNPLELIFDDIFQSWGDGCVTILARLITLPGVVPVIFFTITHSVSKVWVYLMSMNVEFRVHLDTLKNFYFRRLTNVKGRFTRFKKFFSFVKADLSPEEQNLPPVMAGQARARTAAIIEENTAALNKTIEESKAKLDNRVRTRSWPFRFWINIDQTLGSWLGNVYLWPKGFCVRMSLLDSSKISANAFIAVVVAGCLNQATFSLTGFNPFMRMFSRPSSVPKIDIVPPTMKEQMLSSIGDFFKNWSKNKRIE